MYYCANCGANVSSNETYCLRCGALTNVISSDLENPYVARDFSSGYADNDAENEIPGFVQAISRCFKKIFDLNGRASRSEYWFFYLACWITMRVVAFLIGFMFGLFWGLTGRGDEIGDLATNLDCVYMIATSILWFFLFFSVMVRRLHDRNETGRQLFWLLLPIVGVIIILIKFILPGTPGPNAFGPAPIPRRR